MRLRGVPGDFRCTVATPSSLVLPTPVWLKVPSLSWTTTPFHRTPQGPQWWPTGCRIPWAQVNRPTPPPPTRCGMQMLFANLDPVKIKAAEQHSQTNKLFSDIAIGAFHGDTRNPPWMSSMGSIPPTPRG